MVTALSSHQCGGLGSIPGPCSIFLRVFLRIVKNKKKQNKTKYSKFQFDLESVNEEPPRGCVTAKSKLLFYTTMESRNTSKHAGYLSFPLSRNTDISNFPLGRGLVPWTCVDISKICQLSVFSQFNLYKLLPYNATFPLKMFTELQIQIAK